MSIECLPGGEESEQLPEEEELVVSREAGWVSGVGGESEARGEEQSEDGELKPTVSGSWLDAFRSRYLVTSSDKTYPLRRLSGTFQSPGFELPQRKFFGLLAQQRHKEKVDVGEQREREADADAWCKFFSRKSVGGQKSCREDVSCLLL